MDNWLKALKLSSGGAREQEKEVFMPFFFPLFFLFFSFLFLSILSFSSPLLSFSFFFFSFQVVRLFDPSIGYPHCHLLSVDFSGEHQCNMNDFPSVLCISTVMHNLMEKLTLFLLNQSSHWLSTLPSFVSGFQWGTPMQYK
jgi:hypothetical protein